MSKTIYALATPPGRGGVAIIRVSGSMAYDSLKKLTGRAFIAPRQAVYCSFTDPVSRETIDHGLVLYFKGSKSFTGEDVAEYHIHGGMAIAREMLTVLSKQEGHALAQPGEFTRRAFENGKLDLTEAEAIADLIDAETSLQKTQALNQLEGSLSLFYKNWHEELKKALAHLEADLEFPDEDMPDGVAPQAYPVIEALLKDMGAHLDDNRRGERLRDGIHIAVIGAPNAGKSSLVNSLAQRDVAIVSAMAGTTRDVIEVHLDFGGYPVILADTAGLRPDQLGEDAQDEIESEGMRRALERAQNADIRLLLFDATEAHMDKHTADLADDNSVVVFNKCDVSKGGFPDREGFDISVKTGAGLDDLVAALTKKIEALIGCSETPSLTRQRHREALEECRLSLNRALTAKMPELVAEDVRLAMRALGRITGRVDVEDLLDVIFKDFCIGK